jgi:hypothetical protein
VKNNSTKFATLDSNSAAGVGAFAIALKLDETVIETESVTDTSELEKRMLLFRLSDAAARIRDEANLIRRTAFTDASGRLLRILGETVEEQRAALDSSNGGAGK